MIYYLVKLPIFTSIIRYHSSLRSSYLIYSVSICSLLQEIVLKKIFKKHQTSGFAIYYNHYVN